MWKRQHLATPWASRACYRDSSTFYCMKEAIKFKWSNTHIKACKVYLLLFLMGRKICFCCSWIEFPEEHIFTSVDRLGFACYVTDTSHLQCEGVYCKGRWSVCQAQWGVQNSRHCIEKECVCVCVTGCESCGCTHYHPNPSSKSEALCQVSLGTAGGKAGADLTSHLFPKAIFSASVISSSSCGTAEPPSLATSHGAEQVQNFLSATDS